MPPAGLSGSYGMNVPTYTPAEPYGGIEKTMEALNIDPSTEAGLDVWEQMAADREGRDVRTENVLGEAYDLGGVDIPLLDNQLDRVIGNKDNQLDLIGNNPVNDTYLRYFMGQGLSDDDAWALMHYPDSIDAETKLHEEHPGISDDFYDMTAQHRLDDGTLLYGNLTADSMTGTQYKHYRDDLGMGGSEIIEPDRTYSKREEMVENGFKPFTPDYHSYLNMVGNNVLALPSRIGRAVANGREYITPDYEISYDGGTLSGRDAERRLPAYINDFYHDRKYNPDRYLSAPTDGTPYSTYVNQYMVPDVDGNKTYHYGHLVDVYPTSDGSWQFSFSDGSSVLTTQEYLDQVMKPDNKWEIEHENIPVQRALGLVDVDSLKPENHAAMINEYVVPDEYGDDTYHYGNLLSVDYGPNGTYAFTFEDGSTVNAPASFFEQSYDPETNMVNIPSERVWIDDVKGDLDVEYETEKPTIDNTDVLYIPDLVMSNGDRVNIGDAERIYLDQTPGDDDNSKYNLSDDDISYRFSGLGNGSPVRDLPVVGPLADTALTIAGKLPVLRHISNRPSRLGGQELLVNDDDIFNPKSWDLSNVANDIADWTFGSIPISAGSYIPWIYSMSGASQAVNGVNPMSYDPATGSYGLTMGDYDDEGNLRHGIFSTDENGNIVRNDDKTESTRWWNSAGNLLVPFTEMIVGPVGEEIIPLAKLVEKLPIDSPLAKYLTNMLIGKLGEGVEEVLGNPFEEATDQGEDAYADPMLDENGEPIHDMYGHEMRDSSTPGWKRMDNFFGDVANNVNAFLGGMGVAGAMGFHGDVTGLPRAINAQRGMSLQKRENPNARQYVEPEELSPEEVVDLAPEYEKIYPDLTSGFDDYLRTAQ